MNSLLLVVVRSTFGSASGEVRFEDPDADPPLPLIRCGEEEELNTFRVVVVRFTTLSVRFDDVPSVMALASDVDADTGGGSSF